MSQPNGNAENDVPGEPEHFTLEENLDDDMDLMAHAVANPFTLLGGDPWGYATPRAGTRAAASTSPPQNIQDNIYGWWNPYADPFEPTFGG